MQNAPQDYTDSPHVGPEPSLVEAELAADIWWEPNQDNVHIDLHIDGEHHVIDYMSTNSIANAIVMLSEFSNATDILGVRRYQYNFLLRNEI